MIPIALAASQRPTARDFVPWRFLDAGSLKRAEGLVIAGVQKPAQRRLTQRSK